ncbi:MAG: pitrilysin family protein [Gemmatimonadota bacterium]
MTGRASRRGGLPGRVARSLAVAGALALLAGGAAAQDWRHPREMGLPEPAFQRPDPSEMRLELDNGLVAYVARDARAPLVTFTAYAGAGSGHGAPGEISEVAAALRRGPAALDDGAFQAALERMAALYSVRVGHEETEVVLEVGVEDAWEALELLSATLKAPSFRQGGNSAPTRAATVEGIDYASSLDGAVTLFEDRLYGDHPFGRGATAAEREAAGSGGAAELHGRMWVPGNLTLAVAGDFQEAEARRRVSEALADWRSGDVPDPVSFPSVAAPTSRTVLTGDADKLQGWVVIGHELPVVPGDDEAALHVMDYILGAYHLDSRLFRESRELRGLTNDNSSFLEPGIRGPGTYTFRTYGRPEAVRLLVDITFRELERIRETRPTEEEIFVAKGALVDGLWATRYATGLDAARSYAREWLRRGDHSWSATYPERIRAVTAEEIQAAARSYIHPERMIVSVVGPLEEIRAAPALESEPPLDAWGRVEPAAGRGSGASARR